MPISSNARLLGKTLRPLLAAKFSQPGPASASYHKNVIDHYENPRNVGAMDKNDKNVGTGLVGAPACGDVMKLQVTLLLERCIRECTDIAGVVQTHVQCLNL
eukprot:XP_001181778.2 PREDICTED: iron-sulfur cluster assembly protein 3-like [Strongylocentrotus purpuratus]